MGDGAGGYGRHLPGRIRVVDEDEGASKSEDDNYEPRKLFQFALEHKEGTILGIRLLKFMTCLSSSRC